MGDPDSIPTSDLCTPGSTLLAVLPRGQEEMNSERETAFRALLTSCLSIACVMGACVICVDLLIRYIPGKQDFRIQDSSSFLACSLSLSFGVMVSGPYSSSHTAYCLCWLSQAWHRHVQSR